MFNSLSGYQGTNAQTTTEVQVAAFNKEYETYNRNKIRGNDIYSLMQKVVDYNTRKTTSGIGANDEGKDWMYEPMEITVDMNGKKNSLSMSGSSELFNKDEYTTNGKTNSLTGIINSVKGLSNSGNESFGTLSSDTLNELCKSITKIFIADTEQDFNNESVTSQLKAIETFHTITGKKNETISGALTKYYGYGLSDDFRNAYGKILSCKDTVYKYYEYVQFKRGYFNCTETDYNQKTGRIISMTFKFTGNFQ